MEKKPSQKVNVEIFGDTYPFKTDGDPEELRRLAAIVDDRMKTAAKMTRSLDTRKIAVLAALPDWDVPPALTRNVIEAVYCGR